MSNYFSIDGYWKEGKEPFEDYLIKEFDEVDEITEDDQVFFYGLSESDIQQMIKDGDSGLEDFVITKYTKL